MEKYCTKRKCNISISEATGNLTCNFGMETECNESGCKYSLGASMRASIFGSNNQNLPDYTVDIGQATARKQKPPKKCDICSKAVYSTDAYLLHTDTVLASDQYIDFTIKKWAQQGANYGAITTTLRNQARDHIRTQSGATPWLVCKSCLPQFKLHDSDQAEANRRAEKFWDGEKIEGVKATSFKTQSSGTNTKPVAPKSGTVSAKVGTKKPARDGIDGVKATSFKTQSPGTNAKPVAQESNTVSAKVDTKKPVWDATDGVAKFRGIIGADGGFIQWNKAVVFLMSLIIANLMGIFVRNCFAFSNSSGILSKISLDILLYNAFDSFILGSVILLYFSRKKCAKPLGLTLQIAVTYSILVSIVTFLFFGFFTMNFGFLSKNFIFSFIFVVGTFLFLQWFKKIWIGLGTVAFIAWFIDYLSMPDKMQAGLIALTFSILYPLILWVGQLLFKQRKVPVNEPKRSTAALKTRTDEPIAKPDLFAGYPQTDLNLLAQTDPNLLLTLRSGKTNATFSGISNQEEQILKSLTKEQLQQLEMVQDLVRQAERESSAGSYQTALSLYEKCLNQAPWHFIALKSIGMCHYYIGNKTKAVEYLKKAYHLAPNDKKVIDNLLLVEEDSNDSAEAVQTKQSVPAENQSQQMAEAVVGDFFSMLRKGAEFNFKIPEGRYTAALGWHIQKDFADAIKSISELAQKGDRSGLDELELFIRENTSSGTSSFYSPGLRSGSMISPEELIVQLTQYAKQGLFDHCQEAQSLLPRLSMLGSLGDALETIRNQAGEMAARSLEIIYAQLTISTKYNQATANSTEDGQ